MRISDWSSDVCSSDLIRALLVGRERTNDRFPQAEGRGPALSSRHPIVPNSSFPRVKAGCRLHETWTLSFIRYPTSTERETSHPRRAVLDLVSSEERRVGKGGVSTCRTRGTESH